MRVAVLMRGLARAGSGACMIRSGKRKVLCAAPSRQLVSLGSCSPRVMALFPLQAVNPPLLQPNAFPCCRTQTAAAGLAGWHGAARRQQRHRPQSPGLPACTTASS